jgi:glycosyltransferase involved in cell wall biosynthesis
MNLLAITTTTDLPEAHLLAGINQSARQSSKISVTLLGNPSPAHTKILSSAGVTIIPLPLPSRISPYVIRTIRATAKQYCPDVVHYFSNRALSNGLIALRGFPARHVAYRGAMGNVSRWDPLSWMTYLHPRLDRIICVSRAVEEYLASAGVSRKKLRTIYKGHRLSWYNQDVDTKNKNPIDLTTSPNATIIGCTANMRPVKGVDLLLKAMLRVPQNIPLHLVLIGEIRDKRLPRLIESVRSIHQVTTFGFQNNPIPFLKQCDIFVLPSRDREGLPKAVIEAMTQGVAPIVTSIGGMPELVLNNQCGIVVEPESPHQITDAIISLATNKPLASTLGAHAQSRIAEHFSIDTTIQQTIATYEELLEKGSVRNLNSPL